MSLISRFIASLVEIEEWELCELERLVRELRHRRPFHAVRARFAGPYFSNADGGIEVAKALFLIGQPYTAALIFSAADGSTGVGPVGEVSSSDPNVTVSLSADGQAVNAEMTAAPAGPVTLTWHDPSGVIPDATIEIDEDTGGTGTFTATSVAFGDFAESTTT